MEKLMALMAELEKTMKEMSKTMKDKGEKAVREAMSTLFESIPELEAIRWTQYTPYYEAKFKFVGKDDGGDYDDGFHSLWDLDYEHEKETGKKKHPHSAQLQPFSKALSTAAMRDVLRMSFGDHVEVTVTRKGVRVEEHSHD